MTNPSSAANEDALIADDPDTAPPTQELNAAQAVVGKATLEEMEPDVTDELEPALGAIQPLMSHEPTEAQPDDVEIGDLSPIP